MTENEIAKALCQANDSSHGREERTRELYQYFQPLRFTQQNTGDQPASRDTVLTAYAQLVAWRLDARRSVISYFDEDTQYNVAEGTKTLILDGGTCALDPADDLWKGATSFSIQGSICLHTLSAIPSLPDGAGDFEVTDLKKDGRFSRLPIVTGPPYMRYYYGTTFQTKKGVNIGTVCVLDDKARQPMTMEQKLFLRSIANNVMVHLELLRERTERRRAIRMNECLNLFINPDAAQPAKRKYRSDAHIPSEFRKSRTGSNSYPLRPASAQSSPRKKQGSQAPELGSLAIESIETQSDAADASQRVTEDDHLRVLEKAAYLLRTSLDIEGGGGVVFMDTANSKLATTPVTPKGANNTFTDRYARRGSTNSQPFAEVLASSTTAANMSNSTAENEGINTEAEQGGFSPMHLDTVTTLIDRFPQSKLWVFDSNGLVVSDSETETPVSESRLQAEATILLEHFPHARQIISLPFWDARSHRWCICFAYSTSKFRTLNWETDLLYCIAFCNCVTIEMGRLATLASDQLKGDFISSISHELRSPLHGILASCEFLQDTEGSSFQKSLVHTVGSCARTLLDTISMILDYTKINAFERDWRTVASVQKNATRATSGDLSAEGPANGSAGQPTLNIYGNVDLAAVTEEVVEAVTAGHEHQDILTVNFGDATNRLLGRPADRETFASNVVSDGRSVVDPSPMLPKGRVEVVLDIEPRSWNYITQPGAFRRIVMNLVGNALKYTSNGWIRIHLDAQRNVIAPKSTPNAENDATTDIITLTVTDTGKGISPEFLRTKLFQAFAQEDSLASGTGLGLSLIRSILKMLNGDIDIVSTVGTGTSITVRIPMISQSGSTLSATSTPSTNSSGDSVRAKDDSVLELRTIGRNMHFSIFRQENEASQPLINGLNVRAGVHSKIRKYLVEWCRVSLIEWSPDIEVDAIITDEADLPTLLKSNYRSQNATILVYCMYKNRPTLLKAYGNMDRIDFMSKPFGPHKLAKALCISLQRNSAQPRLETVCESDATDPLASSLSPSLVEGKLSSGDTEVNVIQCGEVLAKNDSINAHMAVEMDHSSASVETEDHESTEFPFSQVVGERTSLPKFPHRPTLRDRRTMSPTVSELQKLSADTESTLNPMTAAGLAATTPTMTTTQVTDVLPSDTLTSVAPLRDPRVLLVDDNSINLHLLQMFMKKRKYSGISSAVNGLEAVQRFEELSTFGEPPDIIFMDISMPVMNGFEATRRIRAVEEARNVEIGENEGIGEQRPSSLIIALTGLASGRDQSEAFLAGVDLYMTKPVSFKEVGRLLDNWTRNGGAREGTGVPFGAVTGTINVDPFDASVSSA